MSKFRGYDSCNSYWKILLFLCGGFFIVLSLQGCVTGHCRLLSEEQKKKEANNKSAGTSEKVTSDSKNKDLKNMDNKDTTSKSAPSTIKVFKYDGSLQCGMGKAISVEEMKNELKGIQVLSSQSKNDGLMRIQLCGSPTGHAHIYEISFADLEKAQALGFREWTFD